VHDTDRSSEIRFSEVISALSYALDITEGQPEGHAVRTCLIGMRLAEELGLSSEDRSALFYALLLKDLGCSSNAAKICYLFAADDRAVKRDFKTTDWSSVVEAFHYVARNVVPDAVPLRRAFQVLTVAMEGSTKELIQTRCDRGAQIAMLLDLPLATADAIRGLDEHWDGKGAPHGARGDAIPLLARIAGLAQTVEVFFSSVGEAEAFEMAARRRGSWFDPLLVDALRSIRSDRELWARVASPDPSIHLAPVEPEDRRIVADDARLDRVAHAFAKVVDAKSPWTFNHSEQVAEIAGDLAATLGLGPREGRDVVRGALLHDIGKLGISNRILDKPAGLSPEERAEIARHPEHTHRILSRVAALRDVAELAAAHHERLDGTGYHRGLTGEQLPLAARIVKVADIYQALSVDRPYRAALAWDEIRRIMVPDLGAGICPTVFEALEARAAAGAAAPVAGIPILGAAPAS
jgi:putative nucleotidyltransferase with HDIG domain